MDDLEQINERTRALRLRAQALRAQAIQRQGEQPQSDAATADYDQIMRALRNAHAAGDVPAARRLAQMAQQARRSGPRERSQPNPDGTFGAPPEGMVWDENRQVWTSRELMANNMEPSRGRAVVDGALQGITLGGFDELTGAVHGDFSRERARARLDASRRDHPGTTLAAEVGGAVALPAPAIAQGASLPVRMAQGPGIGGAFGGTYGALSAEEGERLEGARTGAMFGIGAGAAVPAALEGTRQGISAVRNARAVRQAGRDGPSVEQLRQQAGQLYDRARDRGVVVRQDSFDDFATNLANRIKQEGADPDVTSQAYAAVRRLEAARGRDISLRDIDTLRRVMGNASTSNNPSDRRLAGMMLESLDDYVHRLVAGDLAGGSAQGLSTELRDARRIWGQMRNSEMLEQAIERARDQASGFENGLRIQFRQILRNRKAMQRLSEGEREAVRAVVRGTPLGNLLKRLSRLSGGAGAQTNMLGAGVYAGGGAAVGGAVGGPIGAAIGAGATLGTGHLAGRGAEAMTLTAAQRARNVAAGGGMSLPAPPNTNALSGYLRGVPVGGAVGLQNAFSARER